MASVWLAIAEEGDALWMPDAPESGFQSEMIAEGFPEIEILSSEAALTSRLKTQPFTCCPWGWDPQIFRWAEDRKLAVDNPPLRVVQEINSRRFSFALECELSVNLPAAALVENHAELNKALEKFSPESGWVIKSEWGMSARERILGRGPTRSDAHAGWADKRFQVGESLIVEPWVIPIAEAGLQFDVPRRNEGLPDCVGITELLTNRSGVYQGSRFDNGNEYNWLDAVQTGQIVAERVQTLGYFGPLGLDAMWYRGENGEPKLRPIQDLNGRWTMGRLSLGFRRFLNAGEAGLWWHARCPAKTSESAEAWWKEWIDGLPPNTQAIRTSPQSMGNQVTQHGTVVLLASDAERIPPLIDHLRRAT